jgi:multidrug efflux system membrane fusion protein
MKDPAIAPIAENPSGPSHAKVKWLLAICLLAASAYYFTVVHKSKPAVTGKTHGSFSGPVSVAVVTARKADIDLTLPALGSVEAFHSVTLRTRVDGALRKIHFNEGSNVKKDELLLEIDPRPFIAQKDQAEAQLARDTALLDNASLDLARFQALLAQDSYPKQQVDAQHALVRQYEAATKLDAAAVEAAELQIGYCHITAPVAGRIGLRSVDEGNIVHASDAAGIAVINQLQPIKVIFSLPQDAIPEITARMALTDAMPARAFDRDGTTLLATGKVVTLDNQIDPTTGTIRLRAEFPNADERLVPNQFVNVIITYGQVKEATLVSAAAVQHGNSGTYVFAVKGGKSVTIRPVETGATSGNDICIIKGLSPGETVVTDGIDKLKEGAAVRVVGGGAPSGK